MFQILEFVEAKLATLTSRSEKHGDEDVPAVSLGIKIEAANTLLDSIDPKIREALYKPVDDQEQLPGVEVSTPVLRCNSFESHKLPTKYEGWTLCVDDGIDDTEPMVFGGCKVDKFSVEAKQGGSIVLSLRVGTSDLDAVRSGFLGMHVGQPVWITIKAPEKKPDVIDGSTAAFEADHPDAGSLFAEQHGGEEGEPDIETAFPSDSKEFDVGIERSQPGTRTARGRDRTKAALEAGTH